MIVQDLLAVLFAFAMFAALLAVINSMSKSPKPWHERRWYELGDFFILALFLRLFRRRGYRSNEELKD